ncbi:aminoacyl-tRNA hydrolase [Candidatus Saccharibacteria bacterium]|nr:MAG: aminoacyl-tRNA hydrolase [Candidatus Saccharibacteria bacterium]
MKLIVGLGNIGSQYDGTRHNIGFAMCDTIITDQGYQFRDSPKHHCQLAEVVVGETKVLFVKPTTFYNESGRAVRSLLDFYKLEPRDVLVIHDELALPFGTLRSRIGGSHAGNNGIKSVIAHIGADFARIRIGILNEQRERMDDADFVLSRFNSLERAEWATITSEVKTEVMKFITDDGFDATTKRIHS